MGSYQRRRESSSSSRTIWIVVLLLILGGGGAWLWLRSRDAGPAPAGEDAARDTAAARVQPTEPREELPTLDASDELVRRLVSGLSSRPRLAEWLATGDLIRRFVGAVVRVSAGRSPREPLGFMDPGGEFAVGGEPGDTVVIATDSYRRYDPVAVTFASLDTRGTAELYRRLRPLFQEAYRDLGFARDSFDDALARAVDELLAVPAPQGPTRVVPAGGTAWEYRDPELETLSAAQKHLLRMGPENIRRVQAKLRELRGALELPRPPRGDG